MCSSDLSFSPFPWQGPIGCLNRGSETRARLSVFPGPRKASARPMNPNVRNFALWVIIFLLVLALVTLFQSPGSRNGAQDLSYSQFLADVDQGRIAGVTISGNDISGTLTDGRPFSTYAPNDPTLVSRLSSKGMNFAAKPPSEGMPW